MKTLQDSNGKIIWHISLKGTNRLKEPKLNYYDQFITKINKYKTGHPDEPDSRIHSKSSMLKKFALFVFQADPIKIKDLEKILKVHKNKLLKILKDNTYSPIEEDIEADLDKFLNDVMVEL